MILHNISEVNKNRVFKSILLFLSIFLVLSISEIGTRIYYYLKYSRIFSSVEKYQIYLDRLEEINLKIVSYEEGDAEGHVLHPYVGYIDSSGPRFPLQTSFKKQKNDFIIAILGGSVAGGMRVVTDEMINFLKKDEKFIEKNIKFVNYATGGYKQPQQLMILNYFLTTGADFDFVINIDGFNEVALSNENIDFEIHISYPSYIHWAHLASAGGKTNPLALKQIYLMNQCRMSEILLLHRVVKWRLYKSCIISYIVDLYQKHLQRLFNKYQVRYAHYLIKQEETEILRTIRGPKYIDSEPSIMDIVEIWKRSSLLIHSLCLGINVPYIHILQPTLWDLGSKPINKAEKNLDIEFDSNHPWRIGVQKGYPLLRAAGKELKKSNVLFFDFSMIFKDISEPIYTDFCHYNINGRKIITKKISEIIINKFNP